MGPTQKLESQPLAPLRSLYLTRHGTTRIRSLLTDTPWGLEVDAFVIPVGARGGLNGGLARAWLSHLAVELSDRFRQLVKKALSEQRAGVTPAAPVWIRLSDDLAAVAKPRSVILATAFTAEQSGAEVAGASRAAKAILRLAAERGLRRVAIAPLGSGAGGLNSREVIQAMLRGVLETPPHPTLEELTFTTPNPETISAAQEATRDLLGQRIQGLSNDLARGEDLLSIEGEVSALAEGLLLRDLQPPLVVGVLGGWGSGKSFVMHLMHERMAAIRGEPLAARHPADGSGSETPDTFPYVGHVYLIHFDAWTYAKSNLWASLMQTVFCDLNQQLMLEKKLRELALDDRRGGELWRIVFEMDEKQREKWLADPLVAEVFSRFQQGEASEDLLWSTLRDLKREEREILHDLEGKLAERRKELETARQRLQQQVEAELEQEARAKAWVPLLAALSGVLGEACARFMNLVPTPFFSLSDLKDPVSLADQLSEQTRPLDQELFWRLSRQTRDLLPPDPKKKASVAAMRSALVGDLNHILSGPSLWQESRFGGIALAPETRSLIVVGTNDAARVLLNRWLIADAYPQALAKHPTESPAMGETAVPRLNEVWPTVASLVRLAQRNWVEALAFAAFFLIAVASPWVIQQLENYKFPGGILAFASSLLAALRVQQKWQRHLMDSQAAYQASLQAERTRLEAERPHRLQRIIEEQTAAVRTVQDAKLKRDSLQTVPALELEVQKLEGQTKRQRQRAGLTADTVSLADFVSSRLNEAFYENQLGLMHQVQSDLRELAAGLTAQAADEGVTPAPSDGDGVPGEAAAAPSEKLRNARIRQSLFPRGPARIVLFVDDLDRCPPDKVVEVLEATQLLVKTSLFVVVLAMDVRFISRALERAYTNILTRKGKPSGLDYIEKIIQIPYQVRSVETAALPRYLTALMRPTTQPEPTPAAAASRAPGDAGAVLPRAPTDESRHWTGGGERREGGPLPTRTLRFAPREFAFVQECCARIDLTPRAIKRLVNVYRLIKIIWARPNPIPQPAWEVEQAIVLLLALSGRYPDPMRDVLEALQGEMGRGDDRTFVEVICRQKPSQPGLHVEREWERFLADVKALMPDKARPLKLAQMDRANFNLVRSFSFVGDIGYQPGDDVADPLGSARTGESSHLPDQEDETAPAEPRSRRRP